MAENIVAGLFGMNPDMYGEQQRRSALNEGIALAQLDPVARGAAMTYAGARGLGNAIGGAMGIEDPQLKLISARNSIAQQIDQTNPESILKGAQMLAQMGDQQGAFALADYARKAQSEIAQAQQRQAQALKALQPDKLTGDERYIEALRVVETKLQKGQEPTQTELSNANISGQMISKPRSFFDQASGQTVTIPATDPSKAFPLTYQAMSKSDEETVSGAPKPTVQQATVGNLPAGSQTAIGDIDANLVKLERSKPELQSFLTSLKSGEVKYNATSNTLDLLGATVLPAFGFAEKGAQVKKDEIRRALTERVNSLLLMAKGTQTEGDATRAADQIASTTTYLSQARMIGAIEGLTRAEDKLSAELGAKKTALQSQGRTEAPGVTPVKQQETPTTAVTKPSASAKQSPSPTELSREQKIQLFISHNGGKPTRQEAIDALTKAGKF